MTGASAGRASAAGLLLATLVAPLPARAELGDPIRGRRLFVSKSCVECHSVRGAGGRVGPDLGRTAVKGSFYAITAAMWNHALSMDEKMREFRVLRPVFVDNELKDLLAFLYFLNYFDEPGDPQAGRVLFSEKHCIQCHGVGRVGGASAPRLDKLPRGTSPLDIAQGLWNHGPVMTPAIRRMGLDMPRFRGTEILDLFAFLRSHGRGQATREFRSAGDALRGRALFAAKGCVRCHTLFGEGDGIGPDLGRSDLRGSVTQLAGRMWNHWPAMSESMGALGMAPPKFAEHELADLFAYVFVARYEGPPAQARQGEAVYRNKDCATCHGLRGEGGAGPALRALTAGESKEAVAQRMWNHAPQMWAKMGARGVRWPRLEADELAQLLAYVGGGFAAAPVRESAARR